jgi:succinate dehydrogenase (ubiquinone) iron-sulfur subunit
MFTKSFPKNLSKFSKFKHGIETSPYSGKFYYPLSKTIEFPQNLTLKEQTQMKKFIIHRWCPEDNTRNYQAYYINLSECGPMVLDALIKIKDEIDPTLSFRRSCREGICGSCSMSIDGRNTLACLSYIEKDLTKPMYILPLPYFSVIRDLVVDMTNFYTQYKSIHPVLMRKTEKPKGTKEYIQSEEDRNKLDGLYECILCACCQANCPSYWWQPGDYYGPAVLLNAYRWIMDSRDQYKSERLEQLSGQKIERCYQIGACSITCPKGLDPRMAIEKLQNLYKEYKINKTNYLSL